jgi:hypothetical protein
MKTVSIMVEDATWETMQRLAQAHGKGLDELMSTAVSGLTASVPMVPLPEERRRFLDKLWTRIDACNVEVGERPTRARTYDHRRFHRY